MDALIKEIFVLGIPHSDQKVFLFRVRSRTFSDIISKLALCYLSKR